MKWRTTLFGLSLPLAAGAMAMMIAGGAVAQDKTVTVVLSEEPDIIDPCESSRRRSPGG